MVSQKDILLVLQILAALQNFLLHFSQIWVKFRKVSQFQFRKV